MVNNTDNIIVFIKKWAPKTLILAFVSLLCLKGISGYWKDLKVHIIQEETGLEYQTNLISVDTVSVMPQVLIPKIEEVKPVFSKNEIIKKKLYKEKGIVLTDKDIEKYGTIK